MSIFFLSIRRPPGSTRTYIPLPYTTRFRSVFRCVDHVRAGADDGDTVALQVARKLERGLAAILHDHAERFLDVHDLQHVFERQRLEVQAIGSIVVGDRKSTV